MYDAGMPGEDDSNDARSRAPTLTGLQAVELQDHLLTAATDLTRLQTLLTDASQALLLHFSAAYRHLERFVGGDGSLLSEAPGLEELRTNLGCAVTALQFQDMASQLISHTVNRLHNVADRLGAEALGGDGLDGAVAQPSLRPNPVTQSEMNAGSVDLF